MPKKYFNILLALLFTKSNKWFEQTKLYYIILYYIILYYIMYLLETITYQFPNHYLDNQIQKTFLSQSILQEKAF